MKGMNKKAVSPLIATVLLMLLVVVVGTIILTYVRTYTQDSLDKTDQLTSNQQACGIETDIGIVSVNGYEQACYNFTDTKEVEVWVELDNLKFRGKDVPVEFYEMISRYLPPEEEEDSYRGDPVESAIMYGLDRVDDMVKYLGLYFSSIRINPYARFR